jgi:hypothetical protein
MVNVFDFLKAFGIQCQARSIGIGMPQCSTQHYVVVGCAELGITMTL